MQPGYLFSATTFLSPDPAAERVEPLMKELINHHLRYYIEITRSAMLASALHNIAQCHVPFHPNTNRTKKQQSLLGPKCQAARNAV